MVDRGLPHSSHWGAFSVRTRGRDIEVVPHPRDPDPSPLLGNIPAAVSHRVRIALNLPYTEELHSAASITHLMGQALGTYLGLSPTENPSDLMGPDTHGATVARKPSEIELQQVRQMQQARLMLISCAQKRTAVDMPKAVLAVEKPELDAGDVQRGEDARFLFKVTNTGDAPLEIEAKPNCGCTVANYDKLIAPGAEGKIEAEIHTANFRGRIMKFITVKSNDLDKPQLSLRLAANANAVVATIHRFLMRGTSCRSRNVGRRYPRRSRWAMAAPAYQ